MADFSSTMAEMIARARPQQAPGQGHTGVMGGGAIKEQSMNVSAGVDAGAIIQGIKELTGYKSPEEKQKMFEQLQKQLDTMSPEDRQNTLSDPRHQVILEGFANSGVPGIVDTGKRTALGKPVYTVPPKTEAAKGAALFGEPTPTGVGAGMYGKEPTDQFVKTTREARVPLPGETEARIKETRESRVPLPAETQAKREERVPLPEEVAAQKEIAAAPPHESVLNLRSAQIEAEKAAAAHNEALTKELPENAIAERKLQASQSAYYNSMATRQDAEAAKALTDVDKMSPEDKQGLGIVERAFDDYYKAWMNKNSMLPNDEAGAYRKIAEMEGAVFEHIAGVKAYAGEDAGKYAERSMRRWFSLVDLEFDRPEVTSKTWMGMGGPTQAALDQPARRRYYLRKSIEMIKEAGGASPQVYDMVVKWAKKLNIPDKEIADMFLK